MNSVLRLEGRNLDGGNLCCLRSQFAQIVTAIKEVLGEVTWYAADVEVLGKADLPSGTVPALVGNTHQLLDAVRNVDQFLRGVFAAAPTNKPRPVFREHMDTEDPVDVDLGGTAVEVRAFDTTYFEIITCDTQLDRSLEAHLGTALAPR